MSNYCYRNKTGKARLLWHNGAGKIATVMVSSLILEMPRKRDK